MSARKKPKGLFIVREPNGRTSRSNEHAVKTCSPAEVRRLRDAALAGMHDERWGTELGRLFLVGKISAPQFEAGNRWRDSAAEYHEATLAPLPNARAHSFEKRGHGHPIDPDTKAGRTEAEEHASIVKEHHVLHAVLIGAGMASESAVRSVCERDEAPVGEFGLNALDRGLSWLALHMGLTPPPKNVR